MAAQDSNPGSHNRESEALPTVSLCHCVTVSLCHCVTVTRPLVHVYQSIRHHSQDFD